MKNTKKPKLVDEAIITFLKETKEGKYAKIDRGSFKYSRLSIRRETAGVEENYYYGVR